MACDHKYSHKETDKFYFYSGRNYITYKMIDYYFCEKCLQEKEVMKQETVVSGNNDAIPAWARTITKKVAGYE